MKLQIWSGQIIGADDIGVVVCSAALATFQVIQFAYICTNTNHTIVMGLTSTTPAVCRCSSKICTQFLLASQELLA